MGTYFHFSYWRRDRQFTWSSEPREGLAICRAKAVTSFLSHFNTMSIGPVPEIEATTSRSAVKRSTDWANHARFQKQGQNRLFCFPYKREVALICMIPYRKTGGDTLSSNMLSFVKRVL